jgi:hypothetical protein
MNFIKASLLKIFSSLGYQGVINTQISIYNRLKKRAPETSENDLLNQLIISRIEAPPRAAPKEEKYAYYTPLLENPNKILEDVIWAIVGYEFIQSRIKELFAQGYKMGLSTEEICRHIEDFKTQIKSDIKESIKRKVKKKKF